MDDVADGAPFQATASHGCRPHAAAAAARGEAGRADALRRGREARLPPRRARRGARERRRRPRATCAARATPPRRREWRRRRRTAAAAIRGRGRPLVRRGRDARRPVEPRRHGEGGRPPRRGDDGRRDRAARPRVGRGRGRARRRLQQPLLGRVRRQRRRAARRRRRRPFVGPLEGRCCACVCVQCSCESRLRLRRGRTRGGARLSRPTPRLRCFKKKVVVEKPHLPTRRALLRRHPSSHRAHTHVSTER